MNTTTLAPSFPTEKTKQSRIGEVDFQNLEFGKIISDHMIVSDYRDGKWETPKIMPFGDLRMSPAMLSLHYGQSIFEGMKAFRMNDGKINVFRLEKHYERFVRSLDRMCMAAPPKEIFTEGIMKLVDLDSEWVPQPPGALYIRPFVYATESRFGVKVSEQYRFVIFTGPVPELYAHPIKLKVETEFVRAARGGTGFAKCGGNYGAAFLPTQKARQQGYDQVLWTNSGEHRFIEESGMMNAMFVIDDVLVTPPLSDSILDGITRESILILANELGCKWEERPVAVAELEKAFQNNTITEAFGAGTAAVVAPVKTIHINGIDYNLPPYGPSNIMNRIKNKLERIRSGAEKDVFGWNYIVT
jgi:branched-chain amino acid aminotransferase